MPKVTEAALSAARDWSERAGAGLSVPALHGIIEAALPHLEPDRPDGLDGEYWTTRFDRIEALLATPQAPTYADFPARWDPSERQAERNHRERLAKTDADDAFRRGMAIGRTQRETELLDAQVLHSEADPTDYEVWRDALLIAAQTVAVKGDTDEVVYVARQLVGTLRRAGARVEDDPADDFAPDDVLSLTGPDEPDEDADADEDAETRAIEAAAERKAQEDFENGIGTYPGHDLSVTTGGCGPEHPCPACQQRIAADIRPPV